MTILADESAADGLVAEHGFSVWVEADGTSILFDTGQNALERNATSLGVDISETDSLVLSHGHYDHTGGIGYAVERASGLEIYCHPAAVMPRYAVTGHVSRQIGMQQESLQAINSVSPGRIHWVQRPLMISDRVGITGPVPRFIGLEDAGGAFFQDREGVKRDSIPDDQALWIGTDKGLVLVCGCAHAGLANTLSYVMELNGGMHVRSVIGGFHLLHASKERLVETARYLRRLSPEMVAPCHCTGSDAISLLKRELGEAVISIASGTKLAF